jgi:hypothetical protein
VPVLVRPPKVVGRGALTLRIDLGPAERVPSDVVAALPHLEAGLRAGYADARPVDPHDPDLVDVWLWRGRHPLDREVTIADLAPLAGRPGEWVPFGLTATGDVARLRWRLSQLVIGASEMGKTTTQVAVLYGMRLQRVPLAGGLYVIDTLGDLAAWAPVLGDRYARTTKEAVPLAERFASEVQERYDALPHGAEFQPGPGTGPALRLVITELLHLRQKRAGFGDSDLRAVDVALRFAAGSGRRCAAAVDAASQLPQKDELAGLRDLLRQRVGHWVPNESMVDPALGDGALERGARLHDLPEGLKGAAYTWNPDTRWPLMVRPVNIAAADRARVFGLRPAA